MKQRIYSLLFVVVATLFLVSPTQAQSQTDIIDRLDATLGVSLPSEYKAKFRDFVKTNKVMCDAGSNTFIEKFIIDQMKANLKIKKQSQLLFVWNAIYHAITDKYIYTGEDGNDKLLNEYMEVMDEIDACEKKFRSSYIAYTKQRSAEAQKRSAEADRRSAEARQQSAEARQQSAEARQQSAEARQQSAEARQQSAESLTSTLKNLAWFYNRNQMKGKDPIPQIEIREWKNKGKQVFARCQEYNLDYKAILRKELGDDKKLHEMLKFYGIE